MPYDHELYWPELIRVCKERREEQLRRFIAGGSRVGREEWEWKGPMEGGGGSDADVGVKGVNDEKVQNGGAAPPEAFPLPIG